MIHAHAQQVWPCGTCGIVEYNSLLVGELLELTLPVYLQRGRTDYQARVGRCGINDADALQGLAQSRLITYDKPVMLQSIHNAVNLVRVWLHLEVMVQNLVCHFLFGFKYQPFNSYTLFRAACLL